MQNLATAMTTRLNDRQYHAHVQRVEDDIAVILSAKRAADDLMLLFRGMERRGILSMIAVDGDGIRATNDDLATIRRALDMAHERLKEERQADDTPHTP